MQLAAPITKTAATMHEQISFKDMLCVIIIVFLLVNK